MQTSIRYQLWIASAAGAIFLTHLGGAALWDMDEALYASCAREMLDRGDWIEPVFNGRMFPEKPPLMFWTMMAGYKLFGVNEWGARFFSAIFGIAAALAAFHLGRMLYNPRVGLWTGLIAASTVLMTISARAATVDAALMLLTTLCFVCFIAGRNHPSGRFPLGWAAAMYVCLGATVLAKGPVGLMLPLAAMGMFLLVSEGWRNLWRSVGWMRPWTALVVVAAVALPWYVAVGVQTDWQWPRQFFLEFNLRPFQQPILGHGDAASYFERSMALLISLSYYFYHIPFVLVFFFPWSVLLGPTLAVAWRRLRGSQGFLLAACWFGVWLAFWSVCKTKLPHYLLPAYPALALMTACFIDQIEKEIERGSELFFRCAPEGGPQKIVLTPFPTPFPGWWLRNAWISLIAAGLGMMIVVPIVAAHYLPGESVLGVLGIVPTAGGAWCWLQTARGRHRAAMVGLAVTAVVFLTAAFGWGAARVDRHQNARPMIAAIRAQGGASAPIATFRFFRESTVYYAGHPVARCDNTSLDPPLDALRKFLDAPGPSFVITTDEHEPEIAQNFPDRLEAIFRQPRFLGAGEMVVLKKRLEPR